MNFNGILFFYTYYLIWKCPLLCSYNCSKSSGNAFHNALQCVYGIFLLFFTILRETYTQSQVLMLDMMAWFVIFALNWSQRCSITLRLKLCAASQVSYYCACLFLTLWTMLCAKSCWNWWSHQQILPMEKRLCILQHLGVLSVELKGQSPASEKETTFSHLQTSTLPTWKSALRKVPLWQLINPNLLTEIPDGEAWRWVISSTSLVSGVLLGTAGILRSRAVNKNKAWIDLGIRKLF